jgi:hypothetical protein
MRLPQVSSPAHSPAASARWRPASTCAAVLLASALSTTPLLERAAVALEPGTAQQLSAQWSAAVEPGTTQLLSARWNCELSKDRNGAPVAKDCVEIQDDKGTALAPEKEQKPYAAQVGGPPPSPPPAK